jgi:CheY-like chemotaxis protein
VCLKHCELPTEELIRGAGKRILVVEADDLMRESLHHLLQSYGFDAECVSGVDEVMLALQKAAQNDLDYHLLICDHDAETHNAMVLVNQVASELEDAGTHVLLLSSADAEFANAQLEKIPNLVAVVHKPFQRRHLAQVISRALASPRSRAPANSAHCPSFRVPAGTQILVIQDDPTTCDVLCEILSKSGAQVCVATCGQDAIDTVIQQSFDLIFQDLHLPDMDGYSTAKAIRATPNGSTVPILALSASSLPNNLAQCLAVGINDFIMAPVDAQVLLRMVRLWVGGDAAEGDMDDDFVAFTYSGLVQEVAPASSRQRALELDVETALARLGGDQSLYLKLLKRFVQSHQHTSRVVRQALERDDLESAVLSVHTLTSAAGNIGASSLAEIARVLESSLRLGELLVQNDRLTDLEMIENRTVRAAEAYLATQVAPERTKSQLDTVELQECAQLLRSLIDAHDTAALDQLIKLRGVLGARASAGEVFLRLESSVVAYDFDEARNHLGVLLNWMQHATGTTAV